MPRNINILVNLIRLYQFIILSQISFDEPRRKKTGFLPKRNTKTKIIYAVTAQLISAFVFAAQLEKIIFFLNPNF